MNLYTSYEHPLHEPDSDKREKMMFFNPYHALVIEGGHEADQDLGSVVILSSN